MVEVNTKREIYKSLKIVAPGTPLREGLESVVNARTGALIVVGDGEEVLKIVDGGFNINCEFTPSHLYELAKMDGAIILSNDSKKILYANTQLVPNQTISSDETGIRHRTAERVAKQTNNLVIAISQRRNIITLYKGNIKYVLKDSNEILNKANQAIQTLEKYKNVLNQAMNNLTALEFEDLVTVYDVVKVIQRLEMVIMISDEIERYMIELGNEGRLISMQQDEIMSGVLEDGVNIIRDYTNRNDKSYIEIRDEIRLLSAEGLLDLYTIANIMGYNGGVATLDSNIYPKGYRILNKIPRIPSNVLENIVNMFDNFQKILKASTQELDLVEGIGEVRAKIIKEGLRRFQEQIFLERHII